MANQARLIKVTRSGGFAGISRTAVVDGAREPDTVNHLVTELARLGPPGPSVPDGFMYQFTVVDETGNSREYVAPEHELSPSLRPLVDDLIQRATPGGS
jgi:hypothetical protein